MDLEESDIVLEDIAHALSNLCRFSGHCKTFYSVAEHSCWTATIAHDICLLDPTLRERRNELALKAILHDASEAYLVDVPRPMKARLPSYIEAEKKASAVIMKSFGLSENDDLADKVIKEADDRALIAEANALMGDVSHWGLPKYDDNLIDMQPILLAPVAAKDLFVKKFEILMRIYLTEGDSVGKS
jgi:5'-deoxynucleotidase YfbR-like HD superfamily hydrolase